MQPSAATGARIRLASRVQGTPCRRADVAKGTIYLYFADKEALFQELEARNVRKIQRR
jgi:hypothetical protein